MLVWPEIGRKEEIMNVSNFQRKMMESANHGFCYNANPSTWDESDERKQMEQLVEMGLMEKLKNSSRDKHGFYALTEKGKADIA